MDKPDKADKTASPDFHTRLASAINHSGIDVESGTPDYELARLVAGFLKTVVRVRTEKDHDTDKVISKLKEDNAVASEGIQNIYEMVRREHTFRPGTFVGVITSIKSYVKELKDRNKELINQCTAVVDENTALLEKLMTEKSNHANTRVNFNGYFNKNAYQTEEILKLTEENENFRVMNGNQASLIKEKRGDISKLRLKNTQLINVGIKDQDTIKYLNEKLNKRNEIISNFFGKKIKQEYFRVVTFKKGDFWTLNISGEKEVSNSIEDVKRFIEKARKVFTFDSMHVIKYSNGKIEVKNTKEIMGE